MWRSKFLKVVVLTVFVSTCIGGLLYGTEADAQQDGNDVVKENKVKTGKVSFVNSKFISIIDSVDEAAGYEHEILMYLDQNVETISKENISEIKEGDTIQIHYERATKNDKGVTKSKDVAKKVKFLRAAETKESALKSGKK